MGSLIRRASMGLLLRKAASVFTLACFLLTSVISPALGAALEERREGEALRGRLDDGLVPGRFGRLTGGTRCGAGPAVALVQDLHCNGEVQRNIAKILEALERRHGIARIFLEGAAGGVDVGWLGFCPDEVLRRGTLGALVDQGKLTGVEYYAAEHPPRGIVYGLEDRSAHAENLKRLAGLLSEREEAQGMLAALREDAARLEELYYGRRLKRFTALAEQRRSGTLSDRKYYRLLKGYAARAGVRFDEYRAIAAHAELAELEHRIHYGRAAKELQLLTAALRRYVPYRAYRELVESAKGPGGHEERLLLLARLRDEYAPQLASAFPHLTPLFRYYRLNRELNPLRLAEEEWRLTYETAARLADSESERDIVFLSRVFRHLEDFLLNRVSPADYAFVKTSLDEFMACWLEYTGNEKPGALLPRLQRCDEFYQANLERNRIFVETLQAAGALGTRGSDGLVVVVTGGFHTEGLAELLRQRGVSSFVITPNVTRHDPAVERVYSRLVRQQSALLSEMIPPVSLSQLPAPLKVQAAVEGLLPLLLRQGLPGPELCRLMHEALSGVVAGETDAGAIAFPSLQTLSAGSFLFSVPYDGTTLRFSAAPGREVRLLAGPVSPEDDPDGTEEEPVALGNDLPGLVDLAIERLTRTDIHSRFLLNLIASAGRLPRQIDMLFQTGDDVTEGYPEVTTLLRGTIGIDDVEIRENDFLAGGDAWLYAKLAKTPEGGRKLLLNRVYLDALLGHGPPDPFMQDLPRDERASAFLRLLAEHELAEAAALGNGTAGTRPPWMPGFEVFLAENALKRTSDSFHRYLRELAFRRDVLTDAERELARQYDLIAFARSIPGLPRIIDHLDWSPEIAQDKILIRGVRLNKAGGLRIGGLRRASFRNHPGERVDVYMRDGFITKVLFLDSGEREEYTLIEDNRTGRIIDTCAGTFKTSKTAGLTDITIRNYELTARRAIMLDRQYALPDRKPHERVDIILNDGHIVTVAFRDGTEEAFTLVVNNRTGRVVDSFIDKRSAAEGFERLKDATVKHFRIPKNGTIEFAGNVWITFTDRGLQTCDLHFRRGILTKITFADGTEEELTPIIDNRTGRLIRTMGKVLSARHLEALKDATIHNFLLSDALKLGGKTWAQFHERRGSRIDIRVEDGIVRHVLFDDGSEREFYLLYDVRLRTVTDSFIQLPDIATLDGVIIRKYRTDGKGNLLLDHGRNRLMNSPFPHAEVELHVEKGEIVKVAFVKDRDGNPVTDLSGAMLAVDPRGDVRAQLEERLGYWKPQEPIHHTVVKGRTDPAGVVYLGGRYLCTLPGYPDADIRILKKQGVAREVRVMAGGRSVHEQTLLLVHDRTPGKLTGSCDDLLPEEELRRLEHHTIKGLSTTPRGEVWFRGERSYRFPDHPDEPVELDVEQGFVENARIVRDGATAAAHIREDGSLLRDTRFMLVVDNGTGRPEGAFIKITEKLIKGLDDHTIRHVHLGKHGHLSIGGSHVCQLGEYPCAEVELLVRQGVVARVTVIKHGRPVHAKELSVIRDNVTGRPVSSFENLTKRALRQLAHHTIRYVTSDGEGRVSLGGEDIVKLRHHPYTPFEVDVNDGVVTEVRPVRDGKVLEPIPLSIVFDNATGKPVFSFHSLGGSALRKLEDHTIRRFMTAGEGRIELGGMPVCKVSRFPYAEVELLVKKGRVVRVTFISDREGRPILDVDRRPLEIEPGKDITLQVFSRSLQVNETRLAAASAAFKRAEGLFRERQYYRATVSFASALEQLRRIRLHDERQHILTERTLEHLDALRSINEAGRLLEPPLAVLHGGCERLIAEGRYREALKILLRLQASLDPASPAYPVISGRVVHARARILCDDAEQAFLAGEYRKARGRFKKLAAAAEKGSRLAVFAANRAAECRGRLDLDKARKLYDAGKYPVAAFLAKKALKAAGYDTDLYRAAGELLERAREQTAATERSARERIDDGIERLSAQQDDTDRERELFDVVRTAPDGDARREEARNTLAQRYLSLISVVMGRFTRLTEELQHELFSEGYLLLYDLVETYARNARAINKPFRAYARQELIVLFDRLRKDQNKQLYAAVSLDTPLSGGNGTNGNGQANGKASNGNTTLHDRVADPEEGSLEELQDAEDALMQAENVLSRVLDEKEMEIVEMALDGMTAGEIAAALELPVETVRSIIARALMALRPGEVDDDETDDPAALTPDPAAPEETFPENDGETPVRQAAIAAAAALETLQPRLAPGAIATIATQAVRPPDEGKARTFDKTYYGIYPAITPSDLARLGDLARGGVTVVGVTAGPAGRNAQALCTLAVPQPGSERPLKIDVWMEERAAGDARVTLLFLDHPLFAREDAGAERAFAFGRGALALLKRIAGDEPVVQSVLRSAGLRPESFAPGIIEIKGEGAVFAFPGLVRDRFSGLFADAAFVYNAEGSRERVRLPGSLSDTLAVDRSFVRDSFRDDGIDLTHLGLTLSDVNVADDGTERRYPWARAGARVRPAEYPGEDAFPERLLDACAAAARTKQTTGFTRKRAGVAATVSMEELGNDGRERGGLAGLNGYLERIDGMLVDVVQVRALLDGAEPRALDPGIIDWNAVPGMKRDAKPRRDALSAAHERLRREDSGRARSYRAFCEEHGAWLASLAGADRYAQFMAYGQMAETLALARERKIELFVECAPADRDGLDAAAEAALHWVRSGFGGVRLDLSTLDGVEPARLARLREDMRRIDPDALLVVALPHGAPASLEADCKARGCAVLRWHAPGETPAGEDAGAWLEMRLPENGRLTSRSAAAWQRWLKTFFSSDARFIAIPYVFWREAFDAGMNPDRGAWFFDFADALAGLAVERSRRASTRRLLGCEYEEGYRAGFAAAVPRLSAPAWKACDRQRSVRVGNGAGRSFTGPGLAPVVQAFKAMASDETFGAQALERLGADSDGLFAAVYETLDGIPGLREEEWAEGWHYLRTLEKKRGATQDAGRRRGYALQLCEFVQGLVDRLNEDRYLAARFGSAEVEFTSEGDRKLFLELLFLAWTRGIPLETQLKNTAPTETVTRYLGETLGAGAPLPAAAWTSLHVSADETLLREARSGLAAAARGDRRLSAVLRALYLTAHIARLGERRTKLELQIETREIIGGALNDARGDGPGTPEALAAEAWAITGMLSLFDLFFERAAPALDAGSILKGAIDPLLTRRIQQAG